jgi:hypothetical protein
VFVRLKSKGCANRKKSFIGSGEGGNQMALFVLKFQGVLFFVD